MTDFENQILKNMVKNTGKIEARVPYLSTKIAGTKWNFGIPCTLGNGLTARTCDNGGAVYSVHVGMMK